MFKEYIGELISVCKDRGFNYNYKRLDNKFRFYYINVNERKDATRSICFSAGIHGNEHAGIYAVLEFLKTCNTDIHILLFPVANPYGFQNNLRYNSDQKDINRRFCDEPLTGEAKVMYDLICRFNPDFFCSLHEWQGTDGYYMYISDIIKKDVYSQISDIASKYFKVFNHCKINEESVNNGMIFHPSSGYETERSKTTLENKIYSIGKHYVCVETPALADLKKRVDCQREIMQFVVENL